MPRTLPLLMLVTAILSVAAGFSAATPLIDTSSNPAGLTVPTTFLGLHINRWAASEDFSMPGTLAASNGVARFTCNGGNTFYNYRVGVKVKLVGMGAGGTDFVTAITALEAPSGSYPTVCTLAAVPPALGSCTINYPPHLPTFGYGAVRSHDSGVNWVSLNPTDGVFNDALMSAWVARHAGKRLMFTMTGTPEWLAASNIKSSTRAVSGNVATINHAALDFAIPVGSKIKIRDCANAALNGARVISASTTTSTSFSVTTAEESSVADTATELLLWGNDGGYGYMNPPKDFSKVNAFITWLMSHYGANIDWIEGPNEANCGHSPSGQVWYNQGQGLWWAGSFDQLGEMIRRINVAAKAIKPSVLIGAPSITGLCTGQPINLGPGNRANGYQELSAGDGAGGKMVDWIDFVPFHIYNMGATCKIAGAAHMTLYDSLYYLRVMLAQPAVGKPSIPIYMSEGGFEPGSNQQLYFDSLSPAQQADEIFKIAAIYAGFGVRGIYPYLCGFLGDYETKPEIAAAYDKINTRIAGKTIHPDSWFNVENGEMFFKTTDGYEAHIPVNGMAPATLLVQDGFDYATGVTLDETQGGGIGFAASSAWSIDPTASIVAGLRYPGMSTAGSGAIRFVMTGSGRVTRPLPATHNFNTFYMSLLINANSTESSRFGVELCYVEGPLFGRVQGGWGMYAGANGKLGISNKAGAYQTWRGITAPADSATHLIVVKIDYPASALKLFVDPTPGSTEPAPSATLTTGEAWTINPSADFTPWERIGIYHSAINQTADELRIGRTWADVTPGTAVK